MEEHTDGYQGYIFVKEEYLAKTTTILCEYFAVGLIIQHISTELYNPIYNPNRFQFNIRHQYTT